MWPDVLRTDPLIEPYEAAVRTDAPCGPGQPGKREDPRTLATQTSLAHSPGQDRGGAPSHKSEEDWLDERSEARRDALCERDPDAGFYGKPWR